MKDRLVLLLLKLVLLLQATCSSINIVDEGEHHLESQDAEETSFLDSLIRPGTDMLASFSLELLEDLHQNSLQCRMNLSTIDMKYTKLMKKLVKYHRSVEKVVSMPKFAEVASEDRGQVEANFHKAIKHMEKTRNEELMKTQARCNTTEQEWLTERFVSAVNYAKKVLKSDRQQYRKLIAEMLSYRTKMQRHLGTCQSSRHSFVQLYCYVEELEVLLNLINNFLEVMENIAVMHYGDDEDLTERGQGSGFKEVASGEDPNTTGPPTSGTDKITNIKLPPGFFGVGPVIISNGATPTTPQATPINSQATPTPEVTPSPDTPELAVEPSPALPDNHEAATGSQQSTPTELSVTRSPPLPLSAGDSGDIPPGTSVTPHSEAIPWLDGAFEEVQSLRDQQQVDSGRNNEDSPRRAPSGSKTPKGHPSGVPRPPRPDNKVPRPPGVDIEVQRIIDGDLVDLSVEVGGDGEGDNAPERSGHREDHAHNRPDHRPGHAHGGKPSVLLDPPDPQQQDGKESWSYTYTILTYFFLTLGVIVIAFGGIIITIVSINRFNRLRRRRKGQKVDPPVLSEKEMLEVMKATGYVNPTYKFYAQS